MSKPIFKLVDSLPENNLTVKMLKALDFVAPGQWKNLVGFEHTIKVLSGETDQAMIQKIGERAIALYNDKKQGYQRAVWLYQTVESMSNVLGFTALMNKIGEKIHLLRFLNHITPKADKAQGIDFSVKLVTELLAYTAINGIPGDSVGDFVKGLTNYKDEALMRMVALMTVDGILPLGPRLPRQGTLLPAEGRPSALEENDSYQRIKSDDPRGKHGRAARPDPEERQLGVGLDELVHQAARPECGQDPGQPQAVHRDQRRSPRLRGGDDRRDDRLLRAHRHPVGRPQPGRAGGQRDLRCR